MDEIRLRHNTRMAAKLARLRIPGGTSLVHIPPQPADCRDLRHVVIEQHKRLTPEVLRAFSKCKSLERLSLDACDLLRADHLAELGAFKKLNDLTLKNISFAVQDLERFLAGRRLKRLTISKHLLDRSDEERLRVAHPQTAIFLTQ